MGPARSGTNCDRVRDRGRDRGAVAWSVLVITLALTGAVLVAVVATSEVLVDHDRARTAADAAALAGVVGGRDAAEEVARSNGAVVESFGSTVLGSHPDVVEVIVQVRVGDVVATARATNGP